MTTLIARRLAQLVPTVLLLSIIIFSLQHLLPGDPALVLAGENPDEATLAAIRAQYHLDQPLVVQYLYWLKGVATGDLGESMRHNRPVLDLILLKLPVTLQLAVMGILIALVVGISAGVISALRHNSTIDYATNIASLAGISVPNFWLGIMLILFFSVYLGWLPSSGSGSVAHLLMPAFTLGWYFAAAHMRLTRSSMLDVLGSEYIKLARLKGLPEALVIGKHALKNALIPVITLAGINLIVMINVAVVVETVFAWPGIGRLLYEGITFRDFPVVQGVVVIGGAMIVMVNLLVDILYALIDPRIRLES
jgi:peptide/nickel transport system permease protein